ncbi:MAG: glycosyltransferase [Chthoniobacterales bacterium]
MAYCNRLAKYQKRVLDLPEVCRELVRLGTDFHLTVAGEGPDERELEAKFKTAGVADRVTMTGRLGADAVRDQLLSIGCSSTLHRYARRSKRAPHVKACPTHYPCGNRSSADKCRERCSPRNP